MTPTDSLLIIDAVKHAMDDSSFSYGPIILTLIASVLIPLFVHYFNTKLGEISTKIDTKFASVEDSLTVVRTIIDSNKKNAVYIENLRSNKSLALDKFKILSTRTAADIRGENFIALVAKILTSYDKFSSTMWKQMLSIITVSLENTKGQTSHHLGDGWNDKYWAAHNPVLEEYFTSLEKIVTDEKIEKRERFLQLSFEYFTDMIEGMCSFESTMAKKIGSWGRDNG